MTLPNTESRRLLTEGEAAEYLNVPPRTLSTWRQRGGGPRFARLRRNIRYRLFDLDAFVNAGMRDNTSQEPVIAHSSCEKPRLEKCPPRGEKTESMVDDGSV
jgi:hypothetical protein